MYNPNTYNKANKFNEIPLNCKKIVKMINDIEYDKTHNKFRQLRDKSTEIFTSSFISNPKTDILHTELLKIVDYFYNMINSIILLNINQVLKTNNFKTIGNEQVILLFKGGNNLVLLQDIFNKILDKIELDINHIPNKIKSNIKVSDNDFTLLIITENEKRYNEIYYCAKKLLTDALYIVSEQFNKILYNNLNNISTLSETHFEQFKSKLLNSKFNHNLLTTNLINKYFPFSNKIFDENKINELINIDFSDCNNVNLIIVAEYICSCYPKYNVNSNNKKYINDLLNFKLFNNFSEIYKNINTFKINLANELNNMTTPEKLFYEKMGNDIYHYKIVDKINPENIKFNSKPNIFLYNSNENKNFGDVYLEDTVPNNIHYVSINGMIYNNLTIMGHNINFDLFRVKFNISVEQNNLTYLYIQPNDKEFDNNAIFIPHKLNIPSEFIDVSVLKFDDASSEIIRNEYYSNPKHFIKNHLFEYTKPDLINFSSFIMYGSELIVEDLINVLFIQNQYTPIFDLKYNKRLIRLFYFYCMHLTIKDKNKINLCEKLNTLKTELNNISISMSNNVNNNNNNNIIYKNINSCPTYNTSFYNVSYTFDILKNYSIGKQIHQMIDVKENYKILQPLLNYILIYKTIFESEYKYIVDFTKIYNKLYNINDNASYENLFIGFYGFIAECVSIIDSCINIFCNDIPNPDDKIYDSIMKNGNVSLISNNTKTSTKYTYIDDNKVVFSFDIPNSNISNETGICIMRCKNSDENDICCDDMNTKYINIMKKYNDLIDGSDEKKNMKIIIEKFFSNK
jgi:hypothetical protein